MATTSNLWIVRGLDNAGSSEVFYTGRAGDGWVTNDRSSAFTYAQEGARRKATSFNRTTALHGLRFIAVPQSGYVAE